MKYKVFKSATLVLLSCASFLGCERYEADEVLLSVDVSSSVVKVGEEVNFTISHSNAENLVVFTGEDGHEYKLSSDYMISSLTPEELMDSIYRTPDPIIRKFSIDFSELSSIPETVEYSDMVLVDDERNPGSKVLKVQLFPTDWGKVFKVYPRVGLGVDNQEFSMRLRFDSNDLFKKDGSVWVPGSEKTNFRVVTEVIGKTSEGDVIWAFDQAIPNSLWYRNVITPSDEYFTHTINLTPWMENWEAKNNQKIETIECVTMKFLGDPNAAYDGDIFISNISMGVDGYYPFATGQSLPIIDGTGKMNFNHTFDSPGNYEVTFIGVSNSFKNYSGDGYQTARNDISGTDYKYDSKYVTVAIEVIE